MGKGQKTYAKLEPIPPSLAQQSSQNYPNEPNPSKIIELPDYLSQIPDVGIRQFMSNLAKVKIEETYELLDWYTKAIWFLTSNAPNFGSKLSNLIQTNHQIFENLKKLFHQSSLSEMKGLKKNFDKFKLLTGYKKSFEDEIKFESEFTKGKSLQQKVREVEELADYNYHVIKNKLQVKKFRPAPVVQDLKDILQVIKFDDWHKDSVNCIDICPAGKLLASASSDGTVRFIDLESMKTFPEITINVPGQKKVHSVALDDKQNVAFVTEDNTMYIYNIVYGNFIASYKGEKLSGYGNDIPNQCVQFTSDFYYVGFRKSSNELLIFDMYSKQIVKEFKSGDKIEDYSISPQKDLIALAIYAECSVEIHDMLTGALVSKYSLDCNFILKRPNFYCSVG